jgi:hypothetical protein
VKKKTNKNASIDEWINKTWYTPHAMEFLFSLKNIMKY